MCESFQVSGYYQVKVCRDSKTLRVDWHSLLQWVWSAPVFNDPQEQLTQNCFPARPHHLILYDKRVVIGLDKTILEESLPFQSLRSLQECLLHGDLACGCRCLSPCVVPTQHQALLFQL